MVWECVNISTFWGQVLKGPSNLVGCDISFPLTPSARCSCVSTACGAMDALQRFNGSRRNTALKMEETERRTLIAGGLGKIFPSSHFQAVPKNRDFSFPFGAASPRRRAALSLCPAPALVLHTTYQCPERARCPLQGRDVLPFPARGLETCSPHWAVGTPGCCGVWPWDGLASQIPTSNIITEQSAARGSSTVFYYCREIKMN